MKCFLSFIGGMVTMFVIILLLGIIGQSGNYPGLTLFEKDGACITSNQLKIFQTLETDMALAEFGVFPNETLLLLINNEGKAYYDNMKINIPKGKCARQIGTYQYETKQGILKTVPAVEIK